MNKMNTNPNNYSFDEFYQYVLPHMVHEMLKAHVARVMDDYLEDDANNVFDDMVAEHEDHLRDAFQGNLFGPIV